jgi:hypothetical protein
MNAQYRGRRNSFWNSREPKNLSRKHMAIWMGLIFAIILIPFLFCSEGKPRGKNTEVVVIEDLKASKGSAFLGLARNVDGATGRVRNLTDKAIKKVEIGIYFLDESGNIINERLSIMDKYFVVLAERYEDKDELLPPWGTKEFGVWIRPPVEWSGKIKAKVIDVEFFGEKR